MVSQLTFREEVLKSLIGALATALLVTVLGGLVVQRWTSSVEQRRRDADRARERRDRDAERAVETRRNEETVRRELLSRATGTAAAMYVMCQHARRQLRDQLGDSPETERVKRQLDRTYHRFAAEQRVLEAEFGVRFGVQPLPLTGKLARENSLQSGFVQARWHQIADLLTVYYFILVGLRDDVLTRNSYGYRDQYHCGLDLIELSGAPPTNPEKDDHPAAASIKSNEPTPNALSEMRKAIRQQYELALDDLVLSILDAPFMARGSGVARQVHGADKIRS